MSGTQWQRNVRVSQTQELAPSSNPWVKLFGYSITNDSSATALYASYTTDQAIQKTKKERERERQVWKTIGARRSSQNKLEQVTATTLLWPEICWTLLTLIQFFIERYGYNSDSIHTWRSGCLSVSTKCVSSVHDVLSRLFCPLIKPAWCKTGVCISHPAHEATGMNADGKWWVSVKPAWWLFVCLFVCLLVCLFVCLLVS